jgi:predicted PurR-regulated permease PerM
MEALGVPQPLLLEVLAAFLDAIPLVGTLIATVLAVLLGLTVSPAIAIIALILFLAYNVFESNVLLPEIYGRGMGISSFAVLVAVLVDYRLLRLVGVLIALPLAAAIKPAEHAWRQEELLVSGTDSLFQANETPAESMFARRQDDEPVCRRRPNF